MMTLRPHRRSRSTRTPRMRKLQLSIAVTLTVAVATSALSMAMAATTDDVKVPSVVGKKKSVARTTLEAKGLRVVRKQITSKRPKNRVVSTRPAAGKRVPVGSKVVIYWSNGKGVKPTPKPTPAPTSSSTPKSSPTPTPTTSSSPTPKSKPTPAPQPATTSGGYADTRDGRVVGGGAAAPISVSTASAMQAKIDDYDGKSGLVLRYTGKSDFGSISDVCAQWRKPAGEVVVIKGKSNVTIEGASGSAANFGLNVAGDSHNIIIRNMEIGLLPGSIDAIGIEGTDSGKPSDIWVDHNTLFSALVKCSGAGDLSFDGLLDIKRGAHDVTVSYNYLHDHSKVGLLGSSDEDLSTTHITFHHNYYKNVGSRLPLQRSGRNHMYNNLYSGLTTSGINVRMGGYALIEGNYFENATNPVTSRDSEEIGRWELNGNNITSSTDFATFGIKWGSCSGSCLKNATDWKTTAQFPETIGYTYALAKPGCVKRNLPAVAGAGKRLATLDCAAQ
jgi:pectate lyase